MSVTALRVKREPRTALQDRVVPCCPRCAYVTPGFPLETVGITYAGCPKCGKLFNR